jgi:hypothetical protein
LRASEFLLRMTVAVPVCVATFPIGSSVVVAAADAGEGEAAGAGWACASRVGPEIPPAATRAGGALFGDGVAETFAAAIAM